jgi:hypothetical protein
MTRTTYSIRLEPAGRPHMQCTKCRMAVIWPSGPTIEQAARFALVVRTDPIEGMRFAETHLGLDAREAKVLVLHVTRVPGVCHKCSKPVSTRESVCTCRSVNIDW